MNYTSDPVINRLLSKFDPEQYVIIVKFSDGFAIPEPYLSNLKGEPWIVERWVDQEMQDLISIEEDEINTARAIIAEQGYECKVMVHREYSEPTYYRNRAN